MNSKMPVQQSTYFRLANIKLAQNPRCEIHHKAAKKKNYGHISLMRFLWLNSA